MIRLPKGVTLSPSEERVAGLAVSGLSDAEIAAELGLALSTVRGYWKRISGKVGQSRAVLVSCGQETNPAPEVSEDYRGRFQAFMDRLPGIAFIKDDSRRLVYVSKGFETAFGFSSSIAIGRRDEEYLPKSVAKRTRQTELRLLKEAGAETTIEIDHSVVGGQRWLVHRFCFTEGDRKLLGGTSFDVTDLWLAEERFRASAEASLDSLLILKPVRDAERKVIDFSFEFCNRSALTYFREESETILGARLLGLFPNRHGRRLMGAFRRTFATGNSFQVEMYSQMPHTMGRQVVLQAVRAGDAVAVSMRDVTPERIAETELREAKEVLRLSFESLHQAVLLVDSQGKIVNYNPSAQELFGCLNLDLKGINVFNAPWKLIEESGKVVPRRRRAISLSLQGERIDNADQILLRPDGSRAWVRISCEPIRFEGSSRPRGAVVSYVDITGDVDQRRRIEDSLVEINQLNVALAAEKRKLEEANRLLTIIARTDALTGLMNQRRFREVFEEEIGRSRRYRRKLSVALIDFDLFKSFNDEFGHMCGDEALKLVAQTMHRTRRESDVIARYGGEEFVMLMPETSSEDAWIAAERLRQNVEALELPWRKITISVGIATLSASLTRGDSLLALADKALYRAKAGGRNRVVHGDAETRTRSIGVEAA